MDKVFELSKRERFDSLLERKDQLAKSNTYYHEIHPMEAAEVDARLAEAVAAVEAKKKAAAAAAAAKAGQPAPAGAVKVKSPQAPAAASQSPSANNSGAASPAAAVPPSLQSSGGN